MFVLLAHYCESWITSLWICAQECDMLTPCGKKTPTRGRGMSKPKDVWCPRAVVHKHRVSGCALKCNLSKNNYKHRCPQKYWIPDQPVQRNCNLFSASKSWVIATCTTVLRCGYRAITFEYRTLCSIWVELIINVLYSLVQIVICVYNCYIISVICL